MREDIYQLIDSIARDGFSKRGEYLFEKDKILSTIKETGGELWVDTGDLQRAEEIWRDELSALTTNNTLANQVVQTGVMDDDIRMAVTSIKKNLPDIKEEELILEIGFIINCRIALRLVNRFNAKVSVELHPAFARDKEKSIIYAKRYYSVCPDHFIIKIPLTPEGYLAVRALKREGIPVNFTLGFSARQNYLAASISSPDYVNIFLGRLNAVVQENSMGDGRNVGELVTISTQGIMDELRRESPHIKTQLIAASIRNSKQVVTLAGIDVLTIPPKAIKGLFTSGVDLSTIHNCRDNKLEVGIDSQYIDRFRELWEVDTRFREFTAMLNTQDIDTYTGNDMIGMCEENSINLFYRFSEAELTRIREKGKIPDLKVWDEGIAIDDLMTVSALQSFTKDQEALDERIRRVIYP